MNDATSRDCLEQALRELGTDAVERRHDVVMERAVADLGLERGLAERIYALAEEERLDPVYAFALVRCRLGVRDLQASQPAGEGEAAQQDPPSWLGMPEVELGEIDLERRLRLSFRRLRTLVETVGDPSAAARAFADEPDVGPLRLG